MKSTNLNIVWAVTVLVNNVSSITNKEQTNNKIKIYNYWKILSLE